MVDVPTFMVGMPQSGKTWRSFRLFEAHPGPAIFADIQYRAGHYLESPQLVDSVPAILRVLRDWDAKDPPPKLVWRLDTYAELPGLVEPLWRTHKERHVRNEWLPKMAVFLYEISLTARPYATLDDPAVRLFTQCYQHDIIPVGITQRPAMTSRNLLGAAWDLYLFAMTPADMETVRAIHRLDLPEPGWIGDPREHHYFAYRTGQFWKGDAEGVELAMPVLREPVEPPLSQDEEPGDRARDESVKPGADLHEPQGQGPPRPSEDIHHG